MYVDVAPKMTINGMNIIIINIILRIYAKIYNIITMYTLNQTVFLIYVGI